MGLEELWEAADLEQGQRTSNDHAIRACGAVWDGRVVLAGKDRHRPTPAYGDFPVDWPAYLVTCLSLNSSTESASGIHQRGGFMSNRMHMVRLGSIAGIAIMALSLAATTLAAGPERPYRGSCTTVVTPLTAQGVFPQELRIDLDCTLAHLGRTSGVAMQLVTPTGQSGVIVTALIENTTTYTSANGDILSQSFVGTALINVQTGEVRFIGTETFEGGTGRFADAAGSSDLEGSASIFTNVGFYTTNGRLAY